MKKPISRTVMPTESLSIDGGSSVSGMGVYSATLDRPYRQTGISDYPTATVPRNYHYGPVGGYDDYRGGPISEAYTSLSRGSHMDDRYRYRAETAVGKRRSHFRCPVLMCILAEVFDLFIC